MRPWRRSTIQCNNLLGENKSTKHVKHRLSYKGIFLNIKREISMSQSFWYKTGKKELISSTHHPEATGLQPTHFYPFLKCRWIMGYNMRRCLMIKVWLSRIAMKWEYTKEILQMSLLALESSILPLLIVLTINHRNWFLRK